MRRNFNLVIDSVFSSAVIDGDTSVGKTLVVEGDSFFKNKVNFYNLNDGFYAARWNGVDKFEFSINGSVWDTNLYRFDSEILKTDGSFEANSFRINGLEVIKSNLSVSNIDIPASLITSGKIDIDRLPSSFSPGNTIVVAKSNGDYEKIQDAIDAADSGTIVLIYPGIYVEQITGKSGVTLRGVSRLSCVIRYDSEGGDYNHSTIRWSESGLFSIENITIRNDINYFSGGKSTCIYTENDASLNVRQCSFISSEENCVIGKDSSSQTYYECSFETKNNASPQFFLSGTGNYSIYNSDFNSGQSILYLLDNVVVDFVGNSSNKSDITIVEHKDVGVVLSDSEIKVGAISVFGDFIVGDGDSFFPVTTLYGNVNFRSNDEDGAKIRWNYVEGKIEFDEILGGNTYSTNLYSDSSDVLKTDDAFDANSLNIGGTNIVDSSRNVSNVSIDASLIDSGVLDPDRIPASSTTQTVSALSFFIPNGLFETNDSDYFLKIILDENTSNTSVKSMQINCFKYSGSWITSSSKIVVSNKRKGESGAEIIECELTNTGSSSDRNVKQTGTVNIDLSAESDRCVYIYVSKAGGHSDVYGWLFF